ncbi:hypothetical protein K0B04_02970 [Patescibacteria group bacterium]|nr:hypothetical protein [Patescibacteria group bacterium]
MNIKLPVSVLNNLLLFVHDPRNLITLSCFFIPLMLVIYYVAILSEDEDFRLDTEEPLIKRFRNKKKKESKDGEVLLDIEKSAYGDALRILDRARADSLKILGRAQIKAQGLLDNTYTISRENKRKLEDNLQIIYEKQEKVLENISEELLEYYREAIEEGKRENIRTLYEVTEAMRKEALQGVDELKNVVKKETMGAQEALEQKITTEYAKIDSEIREYRDTKVEGLNNKIFELLSNMYIDLLREDLDQIKHEKLILELLDREIKRTGLKNSY